MRVRTYMLISLSSNRFVFYLVMYLYSVILLFFHSCCVQLSRISMYIVSDCNTLWKMQSFDNIICQNQGLTCSYLPAESVVVILKRERVCMCMCMCVVCVCGGGGGTYSFSRCFVKSEWQKAKILCALNYWMQVDMDSLCTYKVIQASRCLILKARLIINRHCLRYWLGAEHATRHCLKPWWPCSLMVHVHGVTGPTMS